VDYLKACVENLEKSFFSTKNPKASLIHQKPQETALAEKVHKAKLRIRITVAKYRDKASPNQQML